MFDKYFTSYSDTDNQTNYTFPEIDLLEDMNIFTGQSDFKAPKVIPVDIPKFKVTNRTLFRLSEPTDLDLSTQEKYAKNMYIYLYNALEDNGLDGELWAPTLLAQTSIESQWGNKHSLDHNNFAGIKGSNGDPVKTKEWSPTRGYYTIIDRFKKYSSINEFADDFVKRLKNKFNAFEGTPKDYVKNIRSKGYFTDTLEHYQSMMDSRIKKINKLLSA